jgi:trimeric autotransporter adhesin
LNLLRFVISALLILTLLSTVGNAQKLTTIAGGFVGDGKPAIAASLQEPYFVAQDSAGNTYVTDYAAQRIRKISAAGTISTYAGTGIAGFNGDGVSAAQAKINFPTGIVFDSAGNLVFSDSLNNRVRKIDSATGTISTIAGNGIAGNSGDHGPATSATLNSPYGLAYDPSGNLYISDFYNYVVRKVDTTGIIVTFAGNGIPGYSGDGGPATSASLLYPEGLVTDSKGQLYIADGLNCRVRVVNRAGIINTVAGNGSFGFGGDGGPATSAAIGIAQGLTLRNGTLYLTGNSAFSRVRAVNLSTGTISSYAGSTRGFDGDNNPLLSSEFNDPIGLWFATNGNTLVADTINGRVRKAVAGVSRTIGGGFIGDGGLATSAAFQHPQGRMATDHSGAYYIADADRIRKVTASGKINTMAGSGVTGYSGDGGPAVSARLSAPLGTAVDSAGNLFIADTGNKVIRKVDSTGTISTFVTNTGFGTLAGMAIDAAQNLYVADASTCVVWKITPAAGVSVVAGDAALFCGYNGDNIMATTAQLGSPFGIAVDAAGNIFIADQFNNRIRKVDPAGIITTVAGNGTEGFSGDGGAATAAELNLPLDVAVAANGTMYIADTYNLRIRTVKGGIIQTLAGTGVMGFNGEGLAAKNANLDFPLAVVVNLNGIPYVEDAIQHRVRKIQ